MWPRVEPRPHTPLQALSSVQRRPSTRALWLSCPPHLVRSPIPRDANYTLLLPMITEECFAGLSRRKNCSGKHLAFGALVGLVPWSAQPDYSGLGMPCSAGLSVFGPRHIDIPHSATACRAQAGSVTGTRPSYPTRTTRTTLTRGAALAGAWRRRTSWGAVTENARARPRLFSACLRRAPLGDRAGVRAGSSLPRLPRTRRATEADVHLSSSVSHGQGVWRPSKPASGRFIRTLPTDDSE